MSIASKRRRQMRTERYQRSIEETNTAEYGIDPWITTVPSVQRRRELLEAAGPRRGRGHWRRRAWLP